MEDLYSPILKSQKDCRSRQQKVQEEVQETNRLLEDTEKHLGALQDCQSNLRIEEQQVQSQIDEIVLKINILTEECESVTEQKVCCLCCFYYQQSPW
jgi:chromosome segregation ATPase